MGRSTSPKPRWFAVPVRVVLLTVLFTLMAFSVALLVGILGVIVRARLQGVMPDMPFAYKHVALPAAVVVGAIAFVVSLFLEIRHYRRARTLAGIERVS